MLVEKYYIFKKDPKKIVGFTADIKKGDIIKGHQQVNIIFGRVVSRKTKDKNQNWAFSIDDNQLKEVSTYVAVKINKKYKIVERN